jgi:uncharacterized SAM-binding protein YcdF (DUF218 family)
MLRRLLSLLRNAAAAVGALALIVTFTPLVPWTAERLSADWTDSDGNVLILLIATGDPGLPGGSFIGIETYWRTAYALDAWRRGHFRTILACGKGSAETIKPLLIAYGVPESAILAEDRSTSTHESAAFAKPLLAGLSGPFVLLTSDFHMLRASRCFAHEKIPVATRPIPDILKRSRSLPLRWECFWTLVEEIGKLGYYWVRGWL